MRQRLPTEDLDARIGDPSARPDAQPANQGLPPLRAFGVPTRQKQPSVQPAAPWPLPPGNKRIP